MNPDIMEAVKSFANQMCDKSSAVRDQVNKLEVSIADNFMSGLMKEFEKDRTPSGTCW